MNPTIRSATRDDIAAIVQFNQDLAKETEDRNLDHEVLKRGVESALRHPDRCNYFVAEKDGQVVGQTMVTFEWSDWRNGCFWWIQSVYVQAEFRRLGIFKQLYEHIQAVGRQDAECCGIRLYVEQENRIAQSTYQKLGMVFPGYLVFEADWSAS